MVSYIHVLPKFGGRPRPGTTSRDSTLRVLKAGVSVRVGTCHLLISEVRFDGWNRLSSLHILFPRLSFSTGGVLTVTGGCKVNLFQTFFTMACW